jgi:hypothetical protein
MIALLSLFDRRPRGRHRIPAWRGAELAPLTPVARGRVLTGRPGPHSSPLMALNHSQYPTVRLPVPPQEYARCP